LSDDANMTNFSKSPFDISYYDQLIPACLKDMSIIVSRMPVKKRIKKKLK